jgi:hypothetical protein
MMKIDTKLGITLSLMIIKNGTRLGINLSSSKTKIRINLLLGGELLLTLSLMLGQNKGARSPMKALICCCYKLEC